MLTAASWMLGVMHLLFWVKNRQAIVYLLSSLMAFSAGASAMLELGMMSTQSLETYRSLIRWENLSVFLILIPMVWFVFIYFRTGRHWLAITITLLWSIGLAVNFLSPHSLTFNDVTELSQHTTSWGEVFFIPVGSENPWKYLVDIASLLILIYIADASYRLWQQGQRQRAGIIGGGILVFIIAAGIHTPMVDAGIVNTPYMISFAFLAIIASMSYQLVVDAINAIQYEKDLQQTRQNLDQMARATMLGECTTMLAHELNQPLTAILSNAQAARRYLDAEGAVTDEVKEILNDIVRDDKRASELILRHRNMIKKETIVREQFGLNEATGEVIELLDKDISSKNIKLILQLSADLPPVQAGKLEIQQVVLNFLTNAVKAIENGNSMTRKITVSTSRKNTNQVELQVKDSGPGIPEDIQQSLFNSFVTGSEEGLGLGLGLAICRRIIENHDGHIRADNSETGGAIFSFTLPVK